MQRFDCDTPCQLTCFLPSSSRPPEDLLLKLITDTFRFISKYCILLLSQTVVHRSISIQIPDAHVDSSLEDGQLYASRWYGKHSGRLNTTHVYKIHFDFLSYCELRGGVNNGAASKEPTSRGLAEFNSLVLYMTWCLSYPPSLINPTEITGEPTDRALRSIRSFEWQHKNLPKKFPPRCSYIFN